VLRPLPAIVSTVATAPARLPDVVDDTASMSNAASGLSTSADSLDAPESLAPDDAKKDTVTRGAEAPESADVASAVPVDVLREPEPAPTNANVAAAGTVALQADTATENTLRSIANVIRATGRDRGEPAAISPVGTAQTVVAHPASVEPSNTKPTNGDASESASEGAQDKPAADTTPAVRSDPSLAGAETDTVSTAPTVSKSARGSLFGPLGGLSQAQDEHDGDDGSDDAPRTSARPTQRFRPVEPEDVGLAAALRGEVGEASVTIIRTGPSHGGSSSQPHRDVQELPPTAPSRATDRAALIAREASRQRGGLMARFVRALTGG